MYSRSEKSIPVSKEMAAVLGIEPGDTVRHPLFGNVETPESEAGDADSEETVEEGADTEETVEEGTESEETVEEEAPQENP